MSDQPELNRREFLHLSGVALGATSLTRLSHFYPGFGSNPINGQVQEEVRLIPAEKHFSKEWLDSLYEDPNRRILKGNQLKFVGMPIGGICAGQVYLGGDGQLWLWDIFNQIKFGVVDRQVVFRGQTLSPGSGANYVDPPMQVHPFLQGFAVKIVSDSGTEIRPLIHLGWDDIEFIGEYPIGFVTYRDPHCPVEIHLEALSPFIPLDAVASSNPCIILDYKIENKGSSQVEVTFLGWLENAIGMATTKEDGVEKSVQITKKEEILQVELSLNAKQIQGSKEIVVFEDFEKPTYSGWKVEGKAFGDGPIKISDMPLYQGIVGGVGNRIASSHNARDGRTVEEADAMTGRLISRNFVIEKKYISFMIGGGNHPKETCLNLVIDGKIVRSATGNDSNLLRDDYFDVSEFKSLTGHLEIVDEATGSWGNISVDQICFSDYWPSQEILDRRTDVGKMTLSILNDSHAVGGVMVNPKIDSRVPDFTPIHSDSKNGKGSLNDQVLGCVNSIRKIEPSESSRVRAMISWSFPNLELPLLGKVENLPSIRNQNPIELGMSLARDDRNLKLTHLWHDTWYDSTLPRWFLDRVMGNTATLATMTSTQFKNGRFYGWEGIGCCEGTCGHVYQYAQAMARLFPELERSVREMVDFGVAFHPDSGIIEFRGEYGNGYAVDSQAGYILRAYREHQMSKNSDFLNRLWPRIKLALQYLILQDGNGDGLIENRQHNTLDVDLYGPSSWLSSLYLASVSAGAAMADEVSDNDFNEECRRILSVGYSNFSNHLWNGEYFIQVPAPGHPDALVYGDGCEVDQVMGEAWKWQVGLMGEDQRLFDPVQTKTALANLYKYNFLPDVGPYRDKYTAGRWYALPGEGGLVICTFPKGDRNKILGDHPVWASMYFNECMTGYEYEAAAHMIAEGLVQEGLTIIKTIDDRYDPLRHNPWNEVECSDHYARCMAVYGAFLNICGYEHHGPKGHLGFAPRITPENFKCAFTTCSGWGTYRQEFVDGGIEYSVHLKYGELELNSFSIELVPGRQNKLEVKLDGNSQSVKATQSGDRVLLLFNKPLHLAQGSTLSVRL